MFNKRRRYFGILGILSLLAVALVAHAVPGDEDDDGIPDDSDNCPFYYNPDQSDIDIDGIGDFCDPDFEICFDLEDNDGDDLADCEDPDCTADSCCIDTDSDTWPDCFDNCPDVANPGQEDSDGDFIGDACQNQDADFDGVADSEDNCVSEPNPDQKDSDFDGIGNACDPAESRCNNGESDDADDDLIDCDDPDCAGAQACLPPPDSDGDGVPNAVDNCPKDFNPDQADNDGEGAGNVCDTSPDGRVVGDQPNIADPTTGGGGCGLASGSRTGTNSDLFVLMALPALAWAWRRKATGV